MVDICGKFIDMSSEAFTTGMWVKNTSSERNVGIVTKVIDAEWCEVFWTGSSYLGTIRRDGTVAYANFNEDREPDRIVRMGLTELVGLLNATESE